MRAPRRRFAAVLLTGALAATTFATEASSAPSAGPSSLPASGPCPENGNVSCHFQYGEVHFDGQNGYAGVDDGDTIDVELYRAGTTNLSGNIIEVRFTGINAPEFIKHSSTPNKWIGDGCHAIPAAHVVYDAVQNNPDNPSHLVRLASMGRDPMSGNRHRREVDAWNGSTGSWIDLGLQEVAAGLALVDALGSEYAWNRPYMTASQRAQRAHIGMFDPDACGSGPQQTAKLRVWVKWDADGGDQNNLNGEWARIRNDGGSAVGIGGWYLRDSFKRGYLAHGFVFPRGTSIPAHSEITLHVGNGTNTAKNFYWKQTHAVWENEVGKPLFRGDGGYLFDKDGDARAWMSYPCFVRCGTFADGKFRITVNAKGATTEWVQLKNTSSRTVNLEGYLLWQNPDSYAFGHHDKLKPGQTLRLYMQKGTRGATIVRSWHLPAYQLRDAGDVVKLTDYRNHTVRCKAWGPAHC